MSFLKTSSTNIPDFMHSQSQTQVHLFHSLPISLTLSGKWWKKVKGGIRRIPGLGQGHCTHSTKSNQRTLVKRCAKRKAFVGLCLTPELNIDTCAVSKRNHYLLLASCTSLGPACLSLNLDTNIAHLKTDLRSAKATHTTIFPTACVSGFYCQHYHIVFVIAFNELIETQLKPINRPWICTKFHCDSMAKKAPIRKKLWEQRDWRWTQQRWLGLHNGTSLCEKERRWHGSWLHERGAIVPWIEKSIWLRLNSLFDGFISLYSELDDEPALIYRRMMGNDRHPCTRVKVSLLYICTFNIWKLYNIKELKYLKCKPFKLLKKKLWVVLTNVCVKYGQNQL